MNGIWEVALEGRASCIQSPMNGGTVIEDEAIRSAIHHFSNKRTYSDLLEFEGKVQWEGNLDEMREERV